MKLITVDKCRQPLLQRHPLVVRCHRKERRSGPVTSVSKFSSLINYRGFNTFRDPGSTPDPKSLVNTSQHSTGDGFRRQAPSGPVSRNQTGDALP